MVLFIIRFHGDEKLGTVLIVHSQAYIFEKIIDNLGIIQKMLFQIADITITNIQVPKLFIRFFIF